MQNLHFPILTGDRYMAAVNTAKDQTRKRLELPRPEQFKSSTFSTYSPTFKRNVLIALALLTIFSFVISAGKQAAAAGLVLDGLPDHFNHLSQIWSNISIAFMLLLGEVGAITFMVVSGVVGEAVPKSHLWDREISLPRWILRGFAVLCASYAVVANVSITILDPIPSVALLQWLISVGVPLLVLGLAYMLELIVIGDMKAASESKYRYERALSDYQAVMQEPEKHDLYKRALFDALYAELTRTAVLRNKLGLVYEATETDFESKKWLVFSEFNAHQQTFDFGGPVNPFLSPTSSDD